MILATEQIIPFIRRLVQTRSQNGIDSEKAIAGMVTSKLKEFGFDYIIIGSRERPSILAKIGNPSGKKLWLQVMLDTVPVGDENSWNYPPFSATIVDGKLFGRGAADSKAAIAIYIYLAKLLKDDGVLDKHQIILGFDSDEQSGEFTGIKEILKTDVNADAVILGYPSTKEITIGARGWLRLKLSTFGKSAHTGSRRRLGVNAIHSMVKFLSALVDLKLPYKKTKLFEFGPSFNISLINGGTYINIIPDKCEASLDIRLVPSQTKEVVLMEINQQIDLLKKLSPDLEVKVEILQYEPAFQTNENEPIVKILKRNAERKLGRAVPTTASGSGSVGNLIAKVRKGLPIINSFGVDCGNIHAPNEYIEVSSVGSVVDIFHKTALEFFSK